MLLAHSVHFERSDDGLPLAQPGDEELELEEAETVDLPCQLDLSAMFEVNDPQKRNLDRWCFAEHFEPQVLLQVRFCTFDLMHFDVIATDVH